MRITTLGTSCASQTLSRTQCCNALTIAPNVVYLFDCGSAIASNLLQAGIKHAHIHKIFITHLHTDHVIGLPGLLTDLLDGHGGNAQAIRNGQSRTIDERVIDIYGPAGLTEFIRTTFRLTYVMPASSFRIHELLQYNEKPYESDPYPGEISTPVITAQDYWEISHDHACRITAASIKHSVPCLGYIVRQDDYIRIPREYIESLRLIYASNSSEYRESMRALRSGASVTLDELMLDAITPTKGKAIIILGDTSDASNVLKYIHETDVVVHEATNAYIPGLAKASESFDGVRTRAISRGHSTPEMAGSFAKQCHAKTLILTHFSSKYSGADRHGAIQVMKQIEAIAKLAGAANETNLRQVHGGDIQHCNGMFEGRVIAAWDGMYIDF